MKRPSLDLSAETLAKMDDGVARALGVSSNPSSSSSTSSPSVIDEVRLGLAQGILEGGRDANGKPLDSKERKDLMDYISSVGASSTSSIGGAAFPEGKTTKKPWTKSVKTSAAKRKTSKQPDERKTKRKKPDTTDSKDEKASEEQGNKRHKTPRGLSTLLEQYMDVQENELRRLLVSCDDMIRDPDSEMSALAARVKGFFEKEIKMINMRRRGFSTLGIYAFV